MLGKKRTGAFDAKLRELVYTRAAGKCERCGTPGQMQYHHRRPRGMGGTRRTDTAGAANALLLHPSCHEWVERNRAAALDQGFLVTQQHDPAAIPVRLWNGWCLLTPDGGYIDSPGEINMLDPL